MCPSDPIRQEFSSGYRTLIKKTLVNAVESVFTADFIEPDFRDLRVSTEYPLTPLEYPAIYIKYNGQKVQNAGVGHTEYFTLPTGCRRAWGHYRFEGSAEFRLLTLSPLDRDVLADTFVDMCAFSRFSKVLAQFTNVLYGFPTDPYNPVSLLQQIALNTNVLQEGAEEATIAPWNPEDVLVYSTSFIMDCHGGFYNSTQCLSASGNCDACSSFITSVLVTPNIAQLYFDEFGNAQWLYPDHSDEATIIGTSLISAVTT